MSFNTERKPTNEVMGGVMINPLITKMKFDTYLRRNIDVNRGIFVKFKYARFKH